MGERGRRHRDRGAHRASSAPRPWRVLVGSAAFGAAIAPQFPTMLAHLHRGVPLTGTVTAWCIAGSAVGGLLLPPLIGALFDSVGARGAAVDDRGVVGGQRRGALRDRPVRPRVRAGGTGGRRRGTGLGGLPSAACAVVVPAAPDPPSGTRPGTAPRWASTSTPTPCSTRWPTSSCTTATSTPRCAGCSSRASRTATASSSWACARCSSGCASAGRRRSRTAISAASTTRSPSSSQEVVEQERAGIDRRIGGSAPVGRPAPPGDRREPRRRARPRARAAPRRPRGQGAVAPELRLHGRRRARPVRGAHGPAARPADAELLQPDVRGHAEHHARADGADEGHARRAQPDARAARARARSPTSQGFMDRYGDFFPGNPETLDELLEQMAQSMAAMQQMLNSMTPEQRAQLQQLSESLLEDMDFRWQMDELSRNLQQAFPNMNWGQQLDFNGDQPMSMGQMSSVLQTHRRARRARADAPERHPARPARRGRHRPGARPARRRRGPLARAAARTWRRCSRTPG